MNNSKTIATMTANDINCYVIEQTWPGATPGEERFDLILGYLTRMDIQTYFNKETGHEGEGLTYTNKEGFSFRIMTVEDYCNAYEGVGTVEENLEDALFDMNDPELVEFIQTEGCPYPYHRG